VDFRAGAIHAFDSIDHFFLIGQILGPNMAWLLKKIGVRKEFVAPGLRRGKPEPIV
jgi:hypothetical protein